MTMSLWAFRFLLWFICVLFIQPQNRFTFLHPLHIGDIVAIAAVGLHFLACSKERRPFIRLGGASRAALVLLLLGLYAQYAGAFQTNTAWNQAIDVMVKVCVVVFILEASALTPQRVWAVQATLMLCTLWWVKAGLRLSAAGATYVGDRIMGAAVSMISNPNGFAYLMTCYVPLFFYFYWQESRKAWKMVYLFVAFAAIFVVLQTGSRTGMISMAFTMAFMMGRLLRTDRKMVVIGAAALFVVTGFVSEGNIERFKTIRHSIDSFFHGSMKEGENIDEQSSVERYYRNKHTWEMIKLHPFGLGTDPDKTLFPEEHDFAIGEAHNELLMAGRTMGLPGMALYLAAVWMPFYYGRRIRKLVGRSMPGYALLGWLFQAQAVAFAVGGQFVPGCFNYPQMILVASASALWLNLSGASAPAAGAAWAVPATGSVRA
jgi:O-antigen ligase